MPRHVDVFLDGVSLQSAAPIARVKSVTEDVPSLDVTAANYAGWDGQRPVRAMRRSLRVTIAAQLMECHDLAARASAQEAVAAWAGRGGMLTVSYRPDRRLRVVTTKAPSIGKARDYTQEITIEFTAYASPYWEDAIERTVSGETGATGTIALYSAGTEEAPLDVTVVPATALTEISVSCNGETIALEDLSIAADAELTFRHTEDGFLVIRCGNSSLISHRTAESADDLMIRPGANAIEWTADASCAVSVKARGRYL